MANEKTLLLVGYGWFSGIPDGETNNAELIARALDGETLRAGGKTARIRSLVVPVLWAKAFAPVAETINTLKPDAVLALGTDASAGAMRPEPFGVNWCRGRDAGADSPLRSEPIVQGGSESLRGTLPYEAMVRAMLTAGIPAQLGGLSPAAEGAPLSVANTAGTYLCNFMAYNLALLSAKSGLPAGFMHVPTQPAYACRRRLSRAETDSTLLSQPLCAMPLDMMVDGTRAALCAVLKTL